MARFAPVCPLGILDMLIERNLHGNYHLPLAHDVLAHPEEYSTVFGQIIPRGPLRTVILDNSVIELGESVDKHTIAEAARIVNADVIVLPDVLRDGEATTESCQEAYHDWDALLRNQLSGEIVRSFMFVPQGRSIEEFVACAESMNSHPNIGWWGIPRNFNIQGLGSRKTAVDICHMINPYRKIHLLGFSDNILDDMLSARDLRVAGIDSAVPLRAATLSYEMSLSLDADLPPRGDWWDHPDTLPNTNPELVCANVNQVHQYIRAAEWRK